MKFCEVCESNAVEVSNVGGLWLCADCESTDPRFLDMLLDSPPSYTLSDYARNAETEMVNEMRAIRILE